MSNGDFTELLATEEAKIQVKRRNLEVLVFFIVALLTAYFGNFLPHSSRAIQGAVYETLFEPPYERYTRLYWKNFLEHSKSGTVTARASHYARAILKQNVSASADSLLAKIEQGPFWSRNTDYLVKEIGMSKNDASIVTEELKKEKSAESKQRHQPERVASAAKSSSGRPTKGDYRKKDIVESWEGTDYYALPNTVIVDDQTYFPVYFALFCLCYVAIMVGALFYCFRKTTKEQLERRKQQQAIATALADAAAQR